MLNFRNIILSVFDPQDGESVIILNDFPLLEKHVDEDYIQRKELANLWHSAFVEISKERKIIVEPMVYYEPTEGHGIPLPRLGCQGRKTIDLHEKLRFLHRKSIVVALTRYSATGPLDLLLKKQKFRLVSMPKVMMDMPAFEADHAIVAKKARILAQRLTAAIGARVKFSTGHEVYIDLHDREAYADDGVCRKPGQSINLPSGEAYIAPYDLKGSKTEGFIPVCYGPHLVVYEINENKIIDVITDSPKSKQMQSYFREDPARANIAEFGLGCNDRAKFINNYLQDIKIEGMHWAYGYNDYLGGAVSIAHFKNPLTAIHIGIIYTKEAKIKINRIELYYRGRPAEVIMENSRYSFNIVHEFEH